MSFKKLALTILALAFCCYAACLLKLSAVSTIFFVGLFYLPLFLLVAKVIFALLPKDTKQKFAKHQLRFHLIILWCFVLLALGREVISYHYLKETVYLIRLPAKLGLLTFTMFYCHLILKNGRTKKTVTLTVIYLLFILSPIIKASITYTPDTDRNFDLQNLKTLGYVDWVNDEKNIDKTLVTTYDPNLSCEGLNLYTTTKPGYVFLIDMKGNVLHEWNLEVDNEYIYVWPYAQLCKNADLVAHCNKSILAKINWKSNRIWNQKIRAHHVFYIDQNQDIYVLNKKYTVTLWRGLPVPLIEDRITVFSPDGRFKRNIMFLDAAKKHLTFKRVVGIYKYIFNPDKIKLLFKRKLLGNYVFDSSTFDVLHTNSVAVIERNIQGLCEKGDLLISIREMNLVAILNPQKSEFVWEWGPGIISAQHHATLLENDNILLFDNGYGRGYSRVIEINPILKKITWQYQAEPPEDFHSPRRGCCQRLPNGNTLITESERGKVFEVTKTGKIVWRFYVPEIDRQTNKRRALYRMTRITNPQEYSLPKNP